MTTPEQPSRFHAAPSEIDAFLREHFAEDVLLNFYRAVGDEVLDEALTHGRQHRAAKEQSGNFKHVYLAGMADVMDEIWDFRYYPAKLPKLGTYNRPFNPPRTAHLPEDNEPVECECGLMWPSSKAMPPNHNDMDCQPDPTPEPQNAPCYRTKVHDAHDWLKGRRKVHCLGNPK